MTIELDPGTEGEPDRGGRDDPARPDRAERPARPDPRLARRRHPRLPAAPAPGRRRGPRRATARSSPPACGASSPWRATSPRSQGAREAAREHQARRSPTSGSSARSSAPTTRASPSSSTPRTRCSASFADQEAAIRESLQELPSTLRGHARRRWTAATTFANVLGPASTADPRGRGAGPGAAPGAAAVREHDPGADPNQIRPFTRAVQTPVRHLDQAAKPLATTTKGLRGTFTELNQLFNALAYNPPGPRRRATSSGCRG